MTEAAIRADGLGKVYRIRTGRSYGRLTESLSNAVRAPLRSIRGLGGTRNEQFWALRDLTFEVPPGQVMGVIGRNGAGKSTLLKILAQVTEPTEGKAVLRGKVGSLLEVGTGFHPELTGRDNVFLSGAILGMRGSEIRQKFDDIVSFAGIEQFIDTPVKRYSSGMYVRLAFAVAAHLDTDILIIDEVLAVGDMDFQRRCLNRMSEISTAGRTVVFVSHNMAAIHRLCEHCMLLDHGRLLTSGPTSQVVRAYVEQMSGTAVRSRPQEAAITLEQVRLTRNGRPEVSFSNEEPISLEIEYTVRDVVKRALLGVWFSTIDGTVIMSAFDTDQFPQLLQARLPGTYRTEMRIPPGFLNAGSYQVRVVAYEHPKHVYDDRDDLVLDVADPSGESGTAGWGYRVGPVVPRFDWQMNGQSEQNSTLSPAADQLGRSR
ncbi:MAG TPA: ABC transporter ATP-binding protein [Candidatus Solibacter sp.]|nr:ABC transporter ATP-binding protein [Candidatus Solibacter sp.]